MFHSSHTGRVLACLMALTLLRCAEPPLYETSVPAPALSTMHLTVHGPLLIDAAGRNVTLRGADVGGQSKVKPYFPFAFAESGIAGEESAPPFVQAAKDFADIVAGWGMNLVRLLFFWEAVEPTEGTYDDVYLGRLQMLSQDFAARGIRVVLDNHQDAYANVFCGEGFPAWTLDGYSAQGPANCDPWYQGYLGEVPDMSAAYDRLWANTGGIQDKFVAMWQHVAQTFASDTEIVAFEIINEPYNGTMALPAWEAGPLKSFFENVGSAIRQEVPNANLIFESTGSDAQDGMTHAVPPAGTNWIYEVHYYEPDTFVVGADQTMAWENMTQLVQPLAALSSKWNMPVYFGEFGVGNFYMNTANYITASWDAWDANNVSASIWHFSTTPDFMAQEQMDIWKDGAPTAGADACVRPYAAAVAGTLGSFSFDSKSGVATIALNATAGGVTELVVPTAKYPKGPTLTGSGAHVHYQYDKSAQRLRFTVPKGGQVSLTLSP
jgi:endoglycosylceramidase